MHLILPFPEALELATSQKPLPSAIESVSCSGDTVYLSINPETVLPRLLRGAVPKVKLELKFLEFSTGVATFELVTNVLSLPVHRLLNLLTQAIPLPDGVHIERGEGAPHVTVDLQRFIDEQVSGVTLNEFYLFDGEIIAVAGLENFRTLRT